MTSQKPKAQTQPVPEAPSRKKLPAQKAREMRALAQPFLEAQEAESIAADAFDQVKSAIKTLAMQYDLPVDTGKTQLLPLNDGTGKALAVTRPEQGVTVDPMKFLKAVGADIFFKVFTVTAGKFDLAIWDMLVAEERVRKGILTECLPDEKPHKARKAGPVFDRGMSVSIVDEKVMG